MIAERKVEIGKLEEEVGLGREIWEELKVEGEKAEADLAKHSEAHGRIL